MPFSTMKFHQYTSGGAFINIEGWKIVPDEIVDGGNNMFQKWRLMSPTQVEVSVSFSPKGVESDYFDIELYTYDLLVAQDANRYRTVLDIVEFNAGVSES